MSSPPWPTADPDTRSTANGGRQAATSNGDDDDDEYGSLGSDDEERAILDSILAAVNAKTQSSTTETSTATPTATEAQTLIEEAAGPQSSPIGLIDIEDYDEPPHGVRVPREHLRWQSSRCVGRQEETLRDSATTSVVRNDEPPQQQQQQSTAQKNDDTRSPLERFRRPPNKALSVTDLVSPAWCELQFYYTLSKHGRKRRTLAMKQGTRVHQQLEDEVHVTVPIEVTTVEDGWALRIWNVIQGLTTLRETGRTRELEVWGTVGGEIVNGVIDEVGYECPDPRLEAALEAARGSGKKKPTCANAIHQGGLGRDGAQLLPEYDQHHTITEFLTTASQEERNGQDIAAALLKKTNKATTTAAAEAEAGGREDARRRQIYITDVKTRVSATLPTGSSTKPTILQLHLYHHLLENLAQGNFSLAQLMQRYNLDPDATFSDSLIAQIASLNQDLPLGGAECDASPSSSQDSVVDLILAHTTLSSLWELMMTNFRLTFLSRYSSSSSPSSFSSSSLPSSFVQPASAPQSVSDLPATSSQPTRISPILTAKYLAANYSAEPGRSRRGQQGNGKQFLGKKSFVFDPLYLKAYLEDSLQWWRGEREAVGVQLQEAWKCRSCDFRDDCVWIHERDREAWEKVMARKALRDAMGNASAGGEGKSMV